MLNLPPEEYQRRIDEAHKESLTAYDKVALNLSESGAVGGALDVPYVATPEVGDQTGYKAPTL
jgi:hypothetical protein